MYNLPARSDGPRHELHNRRYDEITRHETRLRDVRPAMDRHVCRDCFNIVTFFCDTGRSWRRPRLGRLASEPASLVFGPYALIRGLSEKFEDLKLCLRREPWSEYHFSKYPPPNEPEEVGIVHGFALDAFLNSPNRGYYRYKMRVHISVTYPTSHRVPFALITPHPACPAIPTSLRRRSIRCALPTNYTSTHSESNKTHAFGQQTS
ncbi:hypothetical protein EVAR_6952_1 [Eumeta japonica]|uniref:Uncharacterized protein n=1 Tax=Eumeta variegata TaxID=151549 RepID=A0A4C1THK8_EUMVA|nr:hypothetical protein EVAR_6952_1 [Eumeta japonica]